MDANIQEFLDHLITEKGCSDNTVAAYRNDLTQFAEYLSSGAGAASVPTAPGDETIKGDGASAADTGAVGLGANGSGASAEWESLTRERLIDYILYLKEREYASATVARKVAAVKSFCHFLTHTGVLLDDPAADLDSPEGEEAPAPNAVATRRR